MDRDRPRGSWGVCGRSFQPRFPVDSDVRRHSGRGTGCIDLFRPGHQGTGEIRSGFPGRWREPGPHTRSDRRRERHPPVRLRIRSFRPGRQSLPRGVHRQARERDRFGTRGQHGHGPAPGHHQILLDPRPDRGYQSGNAPGQGLGGRNGRTSDLERNGHRQQPRCATTGSRLHRPVFLRQQQPAPHGSLR